MTSAQSATRVAGSPLGYDRPASGIPHMLSPSPRFDEPAATPTSGAWSASLKQSRPAHASPIGGGATTAGGVDQVHGFYHKPPVISADTVCGVAPKLIAVNPACTEVLLTYASLRSRRLQGYSRAAVWYSAALRTLDVKRQPVLLPTCDASDHLTHELLSLADGATVDRSAPHSPPIVGEAATNRDDEENSAGQSPASVAMAATAPTAASPERFARMAATLDVSGMYLGVRGLLAVISTIPLLPHLTTIRMSNVGLDGTLVALLCHACRDLTKPALLVISHNTAVSSIGIEAVVDLVSRCSSLVEVRVDGVEMIAPLHKKLNRLLDANRAAR